jgi:uncharacterized damage-inducible protein DinB
VATPAPSPDPVVARFAAGLLDQHRQLEATIANPGLDLEWQPAPGRNSIGMLVAHNAIVEVWWLDAVARDAATRADAEARVRARLGIGSDDDGMPAVAGSAHPAALRGFTVAQYVDLLAKARASTAACLATWRDADLERLHRAGTRSVTRGWILYHVLEHFAQHAGQVALLAALQRVA